MTRDDTASGGADVAVAVYEQLRLYMHEGGTAPGGHCGLVVLRRHGMAAWMAWRMMGAAASAPVTAPQRPVSAPLPANDLHASLVRLLASLALSGRKARSR